MRMFPRGGTDQFYSAGLAIKKAEIVNLLEDHVEDLKIYAPETGLSGLSNNEQGLKLEFRGYEIKTVRLTLGAPSKRRDSSGWVKI
jgi:alpha-mannosidase